MSEKTSNSTALSAEIIQNHFHYDPLTGIVSLNSNLAHTSVVLVENPTPKPLRGQRVDSFALRFKVCARGKPPVHKGYTSYTQAQFDKLPVERSSKLQSSKRFYLERVPKRLNEAFELKVVPYYVEPKKPSYSVLVHINGTRIRCLPQTIAYLYMGICTDNVFRKGKAASRYPCRDGNPANFKWDNIKPDDKVRPSNLQKRATKKDEVSTRPKVYCLTRNIRAVFDGFEVHSMGKGIANRTFARYDDAQTYFYERIKDKAGAKRRLRDGSIMVYVKK